MSLPLSIAVFALIAAGVLTFYGAMLYAFTAYIKAPHELRWVTDAITVWLIACFVLLVGILIARQDGAPELKQLAHDLDVPPATIVMMTEDQLKNRVLGILKADIGKQERAMAKGNYAEASKLGSEIIRKGRLFEKNKLIPPIPF